MNAESMLQTRGDAQVSPGTSDLQFQPARSARYDTSPTSNWTSRSVLHYHRFLFLLGGLAIVVACVLASYMANSSTIRMQQAAAVGGASVQVERLKQSVTQAVAGHSQAFVELRQSGAFLNQAMHQLTHGNAAWGFNELGAAYASTLDKVFAFAERVQEHAKLVLDQQVILVPMLAARHSLHRQASDLLELAQAIAASALQRRTTWGEIAAAGQLALLSQRIDKFSNAMLNHENATTEAVSLLATDVTALRSFAQAMFLGSAELGVQAVRDAITRDKLHVFMQLYEKVRSDLASIQANAGAVRVARAAQSAMLEDSERLHRALQELQEQLSQQATVRSRWLWAMLLSAALGLVCISGGLLMQAKQNRSRLVLAEYERTQAEQQERDARRMSDANQVMVLRLVDELKKVATGDLTQRATTTDAMMRVVADSINDAMAGLGTLVAQVQDTVTRVAQITTDVDATSTRSLAAANEQLHEIRETGQRILDMAGRIHAVSLHAQESEAVARQSLHAAQSGLVAVQNATGGMHAIRDQIQDTSARMGRLEESSQKIGEISELISDITEQTNVLALNAAIQAACAGDAGRGFSVVAQEVQRLAERSADATKQIATLVKSIQMDIKDAIGAMQRSTQGVVDGVVLADVAGSALTEIDRMSRHVTQLIEQISNSASREASLADDVTRSIQHIFAVTEQTAQSTLLAANQVRELSKSAEALQLSVSRFKLS